MSKATTVELAIKDEELRRYLEANTERILELFSPRHIIAFGSRVSGKPREDSDIDLIVVSDLFEGIKFLERSRLFNEAIPWHLRVDVWCLTVEEFERMRRQIGVVADACHEGVWVLKGVLLTDDEVKEVMTPEEQAKQWLAQGDEDLRKALILYDNDAFDGAVTFAQQAAEKYLKALYLARFQATPPRTHDLEHLAISLGAPSEIVAIGKPLTEDFPKSRYLDATGGVPPYLYFDATIAKERIEQAKQIRDWVKQQLGLP